MRRIYLLISAMLIFGQLNSQCKDVKYVGIGKYPLYYIDGIEVDSNDFNRINCNEILDITILNSINAIKIFGERAKDGIIVITTRVFYIKLLSEKSEEYRNLIKTLGSDTLIAYYLNKKRLSEKKIPDKLNTLTNKNVKNIKMYRREKVSKYSDVDKPYIVSIKISQ